jgi:hypothetical protein
MTQESKTRKKEIKNAIRNLSPHKCNILITSFVEVQRILVGSFLILPKLCNKNMCEFNRKNYFTFEDDYSIYVIYVNILMLFMFIILYTSEIRREILLVNYLYNDKTISIDNDNVGLILHILPINIENKIHNYNKWYKIIATFTIILFIINTIGNSYILYLFYNYPSLLIFITNTLFMGTKLSYVYKVINTETNILYSAYINDNYQFNDIVPSVLEKIQSRLDNNLETNSIELYVRDNNV